MTKLSHLNDEGEARMVDVSDKTATHRTARAEGFVAMAPETLALVEAGDARKGDVLAAARIAGIMAAKRAHELIPLCHPLAITKASVDFEFSRDPVGIGVTAEVKVTGQTGVEMEALTAVSVACLTIYDMLKAADKAMTLSGIRLIEKTGGRSGSYRAPQKKGVDAMALLSVEEALQRILDGVEPTDVEMVAIGGARGRVLAEPLQALLTQPPFNASAMDGYAVRAADVKQVPATLAIIGEAAAGHPFSGAVGTGQSVRIFTGAPVPEGADAIVIQENAERNGPHVVVREGAVEAGHIRQRGFDFNEGDRLLAAGRRFGPREVSLAAAMGHGQVAVRRRPRIAILSTGDELVEPGSRLGPGQIVASNHLGVAALAEAAGAESGQLGIARDTAADLDACFARAHGADIIVTSGGASVGDHDLVAPVLQARGMSLAFWKIAMRPGKPLMFGRLGRSRVLGLPGNPVSSLVCSRIFLLPLIRALLGQPAAEERPTQARLVVNLEANGPRQHYMRAVSSPGPGGDLQVAPVRSQDSSLLSPLAEANCLLVRPPRAPAAPAGTLVAVLALDL